MIYDHQSTNLPIIIIEDGTNTIMKNKQQMPTMPLIEATEEMVAELRESLAGEAKFDWLTRQIYSTDASMYRVVPAGVVFPKDGDDVAAATLIAAKYDIPVIPRGGGTSLSGQPVGNGLVLDYSRHVNRLLELNPEEQWVHVQAGVNLEWLNARLRAHNLIVGPDPSSAKGNTLGGMTGNNSTGTHSIIYGMMADQVRELEVVLANGEKVHLGDVNPNMQRFKAQMQTREGQLYRDIPQLVAKYEDEIATGYPNTWRNVAGYNLQRILQAQEAGKPFSLVPLVVGCEGTLANIVSIKLKVVPIPAATRLAILHFDELRASLDIVPRLLELDPSAVELLSSVQLDLLRKHPTFSKKAARFVQGEPSDILMVEFFGDSVAEVNSKTARLKQLLNLLGYKGAITDCTTPAQIKNVWSIRRDLFGLVHSRRGKAKPLSFADDATVPVEHLGDYVERVQVALKEVGVLAGFGAHASAGCLHISPVLDIQAEGSLEKVKALSYAIADAALAYNGTTTGEHGEGFAKGYHNQRVYGATLHQAFRQTKGIFDPHNRMNPGKKIDAPEPWTPDILRYSPDYERQQAPNITFFDFSHDHGFAGMVEMCSGQGVCRRQEPGVMCPSYRVTHDELHSTRGRANALRAAISGELGEEGFYSAELYEALDLCLECKACKNECPSIVDMAKLKYEFLAHYQAKHGVPLRSRLFAHIAQLNKIGSLMPTLSNWSFNNPLFRGLLDSTLGIDRRRSLPPIAKQSFQRWFKAHQANGKRTKGQVILWDDTYLSYNEPTIGQATVKVLEAAGFEVIILSKRRCCGRPMISKGLLKEAIALASHNTALLAPYAAQGIPIIGVEPSCITSFRDEYPDLVPGEDARLVAANAFFVEEFLANLAQQGKLDLPFAASDTPHHILVHGHCYQKAIIGTAPLLSLLRLIPNATVEEIPSGCCGMAGSFGYEKEHFDISIACGEDRLFPTVRQADSKTLIVASGISCRHQIAAGTKREAQHPIVLLAEALA